MLAEKLVSMSGVKKVDKKDILSESKLVASLAHEWAANLVAWLDFFAADWMVLPLVVKTVGRLVFWKVDS